MKRILISIKRAWLAFSEILGWINTRLILGALFFVVITPIATIRRLMGYDSMGRKFDRDAKTYAVPSVARKPETMKLQF